MVAPKAAPSASEDQIWEQTLYTKGIPSTFTVTDNTRGIRTTVSLSSTSNLEESKAWAWGEIRRLIKRFDALRAAEAKLNKG